MVAESVFAFDAGHVATASGKIFYCHEERGICVVEQILLNQRFVAELHLKPLRQNSVRVDNFRRLDFNEFYRLGFTVEFVFLEEVVATPGGAVIRKQGAWFTPGSVEIEPEITADEMHVLPADYEVEQEIEYDEENDVSHFVPAPPQLSQLVPRQRRSFKAYNVETGSYHCEECNRQFENQPKLSAHMKAHCTERNFPCELCHKAFSWKCDLTKHYLKHHTNEERSILAPDIEMPYICDVCGFKSTKEAGLFSHQRARGHFSVHSDSSAFGPAVHYCAACGEVFQTKHDLTDHRKAVHPKMSYTCKHCDFTSKQQARLQEHLLSQHKIGPCSVDKQYKCVSCDLGFTAGYQLKHHLTTRHSGVQVEYMWWGEKRTGTFNGFHCDVCSMVFQNRYKLQVHKRTHTDERPYDCDICGKRFRHKQDVPRHKVVHSGHKPFKCEKCEKCFRDKSARNAHFLIYHKKQDWKSVYKTHTCEQCGEQVRNLRYHILRTHADPSEWEFLCEENGCDYRAPVRSELKQHRIQRHTHDFPHICDLCNFGCMGKPELVRHMERHKQGITMLARDNRGAIKIDTSKVGQEESTGIDLLDAAKCGEMEETGGVDAVLDVLYSETRYDRRLFCDALKDFVQRSMRIGDIVDLYGIPRSTLHDYGRRVKASMKNDSSKSVDEIIESLEPPLRFGRAVDKYPPELVDEALYDIREGRLTIAEAADIYNISRSVLNEVGQPKGSKDNQAETSRNSQPKLKSRRKRSVPFKMMTRSKKPKVDTRPAEKKQILMSCQHCGKTFRDENKLSVHQSTHVFSCNDCGYTATDQNELDSHHCMERESLEVKTIGKQ